MEKIKVGLVFGGKSGEHEVSVKSAESIRDNLNKSKYKVIDIFFDKKGHFDVEKIRLCDVIFPIIHGTYGEDGCLQGMLEMLDKAYVGVGVLGSAVGMDKDVQKRLLLQQGIRVAKYAVFNHLPFDHLVIKDFKFPVFVKPANMGSSVGVSKVNRQEALGNSIKKAFKYDTKVIVEENIEGREIEVAVLDGKASVPGEVIPIGHEFYDYEAKYIDDEGAEIKIPVSGLSKSKLEEIKKTAEKVFRVLECEGMARVDMFLKSDGEIVVNEINTLPGFTSISMYPKLWEVSGVSYPKLLDKLIKLAIERKKKKDKLKRSFN